MQTWSLMTMGIIYLFIYLLEVQANLQVSL